MMKNILFLILIIFLSWSVVSEKPKIIVEVYNHSKLTDLEWSVAGHTIDTDFLPDTTLTYDIGSGASRWRWLYVQNISTDYIDVLYDLDVTGNITAGDYLLGDGGFLSNVNVTDIWVNESGDTMSGNLNMGDNDIIRIDDISNSKADDSLDISTSSMEPDDINICPGGDCNYSFSTSAFTSQHPLYLYDKLYFFGDNKDIMYVENITSSLYENMNFIAGDYATDPYYMIYNESGLFVQDGNINTPNNLSANTATFDDIKINTNEIYSTASGSTVTSLFKNRTGDNSGDAPGYTTDIGMKIFEDADYYSGSHNDGNSENPQLAIYGATSTGQGYITIGVDDWNRATMGGSINWIRYDEDVEVKNNLRFDGTVAGKLHRNYQSENAPSGHMVFGGSSDAANEPTWVMTEDSREDLDFDVPSTQYPQLWLHDGSATATNLLKFFHDGSNGNIISEAGDIIFNSTNGAGLIIHNKTGYGSVTAGDYVTLTPSDRNYQGDYLSKIPDDPTKLLKDGKIDVQQLGMDYKKVRVKDECWEEIVEYEWCYWNASEIQICYPEEPKDRSERFVEVPIIEEKCSYTYINGTSIADGWYQNTMMIAELKQENEMLKEELCKKDDYSWC